MKKYLLLGLLILGLLASLFFSASPTMVGLPARPAVSGSQEPDRQPAPGGAKDLAHAAQAVRKPNPPHRPSPVFAVVDTRIPERLYVYRGPSVVFATYCNTGIAAARTPTGVFRVFAKKRVDTMSGTYPDGTKYCDRGVPWVLYFYHGCAIHGFPRARYGFPQSLGCVELPVAAAAKVYKLLPLGARVYIR